LQQRAISHRIRPYWKAELHVELDRLHQVRVAAGPEQRQVEPVVGLMHPAQVARVGVPAMLLVNPKQRFDHPARRRQRDHQRRLPLHQLAHRIDLLHLVDGQRSHRRTLVALAHDDAHPLELHQRLAHEVPRDREPRQERILGQPRPRRQPAEDDILLQRPDDPEILRPAAVRHAHLEFCGHGPNSGRPARSDRSGTLRS
jgi:hypothetical protein